MALPTLRHYYVPQRDRNSARVQQMANRTMLEDERRKQWSENTRYFKNADVNSRKTEVWTSQDCFKNRYIHMWSLYIYVTVHEWYKFVTKISSCACHLNNTHLCTFLSLFTVFQHIILK